MAKQRQTLWLNAINREDILSDNVKRINLLKYGKVCAQHFVGGKPAGPDDHCHTDWVPSLNMGYSKSVRSPQVVQSNVERALRAEQRTTSKVCFVKTIL
jgi:hypothetical protein